MKTTSRDRRSPSSARRIWRYAWTAPATLVGLCVAALAIAAGASVRRKDGVLEVAGGGFGHAAARLPAPLRFCAITFGHVVLATDDQVLARCRVHEHVHVRQYERWGVLFFLLYVGSSFWEAFRGNRPYFDNLFERQARAAEAREATEETAHDRGPA